jgi:putative transposase
MGRSTGLVSSDDGWRIPDWLWEQIGPLIPPPPVHPLGCCRRRVPDRQIMNAILVVLRTGMQWNALDATGIANSKTAHRRFQEWERAGVFAEIWRRGLLDYDERVGIDWSWLAADGAMSKAPSGGAKTGPNPTDRAKRGQALGRHGGRGGPRRARPRRREPQRPQAAEGHAGLDPDPAS